MNIVILGCGYIANRVAKGIQFSKASLYGFASRDKEKAKEYAMRHKATTYFSVEECLNDENIDLIYVATPNPTHYQYVKEVLKHKKHVICEKPFVASKKEAEELFQLARENNCFLMEAHKTCFTPLNELLLARLNEIGDIKSIEASFTSSFNEESCKEWNIDGNMGGSFYDLGVYPICFSNLYANSNVEETNFSIEMYKNNVCDQKCECQITYANGIKAKVLSCWGKQKDNFGKAIVIGTNGKIEIENFWKNDIAMLIIKDKEEIVKVLQDSDFTGEINHAYECITNAKLESPIMSKEATLQILYVLENMKQERRTLV